MKDELSFPAFTHDSIAGYCNGNPLYAQYKNDKKSKYIGTKQMWQELSKLQCDLEIATKALEEIDWCAQDYAKAQEALNKIKQLIKGTTNDK